MVLERAGSPLALREVALPPLRDGQVLVRVECCAVCRTDLHVIDGELPGPKLPLIAGHEIVGIVDGSRSGLLAKGQRVGVPWLGWTCGVCGYCSTGRENLCDAARFTGYTIDGGYAEYAHRRCAILYLAAGVLRR